MHIGMAARTPCLLCGYLVEIIMFGTARVNKRSMRVKGGLLGAFRFRSCPECGSPVEDQMMPRSPYRLLPEDEANVVAYRARKWGLADAGTGPLIETGTLP